MFHSRISKVGSLQSSCSSNCSAEIPAKDVSCTPATPLEMNSFQSIFKVILNFSLISFDLSKIRRKHISINTYWRLLSGFLKIKIKILKWQNRSLVETASITCLLFKVPWRRRLNTLFFWSLKPLSILRLKLTLKIK